MIAFYQEFLVAHINLLEEKKTIHRTDKKTGEKKPVEVPLDNKDILTICETHTLATKAHPNPAWPLTDSIPEAQKMPTNLRRAAINKATGKVRSWYANHRNWLATPMSKRKGEPQPGVPNEPLTYYSNMYDLKIQDATEHSFLSLTLYHEGKWDKLALPVTLFKNARTILEASDAEKERMATETERIKALYPGKKLKDLPEEIKESLKQRPGVWVAQSPTLYIHRDRRGKSSEFGVRFALHVPFEKLIYNVKKAEIQRQANPKIPVTTVDLGVNNLATAINWQDHKIKDIKFISGRQLNHERKQLLTQINNNRSQSGLLQKGVRDNVSLWRKIRNKDDDAAWQVARSIVDFTIKNGSKVIVFEYLRKYRPPKERMSKSGRKNHKRAYWLRGKILCNVRDLAFREGILVVERSPAFTSQSCPKCHAIGDRQGSQFKCSCWQGNADFVGAYNLYAKWQRNFVYHKRAG